MDTSFERKNQKDEWLTPKFITDTLGPFDLDPCSPIERPWPTANLHYTIEDNGLLQDWNGFVFCNPPYGNQTKIWFKKMAEYNNGIALTFARTETKMFFDYVWPKALGLLFIKGRLSFSDNKGNTGKNCAGAPSVLIAYGNEALQRLKNANHNLKIHGKLLINN